MTTTADLARAVRLAVAANVRKYDQPTCPAVEAERGAAWDTLRALVPGVSMGRLEAIVNEHGAIRAGRVEAVARYGASPAVVARFKIANVERRRGLRDAQDREARAIARVALEALALAPANDTSKAAG